MAAPRTHTKELMGTESAIRVALSERYRANWGDTGKAHDMKVRKLCANDDSFISDYLLDAFLGLLFSFQGSGIMHKLSSQVVGTCLPSGQVKVGTTMITKTSLV